MTEDNATPQVQPTANSDNRNMMRIAIGSVAVLITIICLVLIVVFSGGLNRGTKKSDNKGNANVSPTNPSEDNNSEFKLIEARLGEDGFKVLIPEGHVVAAGSTDDQENAIGNVETFYVVKEADADLPAQELPTAAVITMYLSITDGIQRELGPKGFFEESTKLPLQNECSNFTFSNYEETEDIAEYGEYNDDGSGCPVGSGKEGFGQRGVAINADILAADGEVLVINEVAGQDKQFAFEIATLKEIADYFYDHKYDDQVIED